MLGISILNSVGKKLNLITKNMININELRIGNYIETPMGVDCVFYLRKVDEEISINTFYDEEINPIPLTEEWLIKFGFEISEINKHIYKIQAYGKVFNVLKYINDDNIIEEYKHLNHKDFIIDIPSYYDECRFYNFKYVHQLQNLYFAITGEELVYTQEGGV